MKAFIIGYYGSDNIGDEVLLSQTIRMIKEIRPDSEIKSLSYCAAKTKELHGIGTIGRNKYFEIVRAIRQADIVVGGGGSMLQNVTSKRSLVYYLALLRLAKAFNKKVILLGNGFGPVSGKFSRNMARRVLNRIDVFVARDSQTIKNLQRLGVKTRIELAADLSYYGYEPSKRSKSKRVALNVRPWKNNEVIIEEISKFAKKLLENGYEVDFLSMQKDRDEKLKEKIEEKSGISLPLIPNTVDGFLKTSENYSCLVGMRLHALIWAGLKDLPFVGIEYDPKIAAYVDSTGQLSVGPVDEIEAEKLWKAFSEMMDNYDEKKALLVKNNLAMKEKAHKNFLALNKIIK